MAVITPFKGLLYNPNKIKNISDVVAPPFDIITSKEQENLHNRHPHNMVWLTLGHIRTGDSDTDNRYTRSGNQLKAWLVDQVLKQDQTPALYLTTHEFSIENNSFTRFGLIVLVRLEPFEKGIVLPHEKTFSNVKSERLKLMKTTATNLSPIFSLYSDPEQKVIHHLLDGAAGKAADIDFSDDAGHRHRLWRITDPGVHTPVIAAMRDKRLFIADGHHRYETALRYREWVMQNSAGFNETHPANYVMMYLCSMEDDGLVILPAHRLLHSVPAASREALMSKAADYFDIITIPYQGSGRDKARAEFLATLKAHASQNCIGVYIKDLPDLHLLLLKPNVMEKLFGDELEPSLRNIDVTVLTRLIFMKLLKFDNARLDNENMIAYTSIAEEALRTIDSGEHDLAFILNPTRIDQVRQIAEAGLIMPRKATYFYPKVITGQVLNRLSLNGASDPDQA